ncbi:Uncharacterized protein C1orf100, partial [Tinamus guttatus]
MSHTAIRLREFIDSAPVFPPGPVIRLGKDVRGFYPGQVGRVHKAHACEGPPGPFCQLQPAPGNNEAEKPFQPDFDNSALRRYVHFQKTMKKTTSDWYQQTSYKAAFDLPLLDTCDENKYTPTTDPGPLT